MGEVGYKGRSAITDYFLWESVMMPDMFKEESGNSGGVQGGDCGYGVDLLRQAIHYHMVLYPFEFRSSPIMSTEITCQHQSGTLLGISFPTFQGDGLCHSQLEYLWGQ